ncbi:DNA repair protein RecO [bacterium]|nr:DNA repair protein RecO [bacterium]
MEIYCLDSIVLRRIKFGDSSLIATLFTKEQGKLSVIAKGARAAKSKKGLASALEPLNRIEATIYSKTTRQMQVLSSAEILDDYYVIKKDYDRIQAAVSILTAIDKAVFEGESSDSIWRVLINSLIGLSDCDIENISSEILSFRCGLIDAGGYSPIVQSCSICGGDLSEKGSLFSAIHGGIVCSKCASIGIALDYADIELLQFLFSPDKQIYFSIPENKINKIEAIIKHHEEFHRG